MEKPFADSGDNRTSRQKPAMLLSSDMPTDKSIPDARRCLCYDTSESAISEHPRTGVSQCQRRHNSRPRCTFRGRGKRLAGCPPVLPPELQARPSSRPLSVRSAREPPAFSAARVSAGFDHSYGGNTHVQDIRPETSSDSARKHCGSFSRYVCESKKAIGVADCCLKMCTSEALTRNVSVGIEQRQR